MDQERLFVRTLEKVKKMAREQENCIRSEQVREAFSPLSLDEMQLLQIYDYLRKHGIGVDEPADGEESLTEEEKDYLQEYLETLEQLERVSEGELEAISLSAMAGDADAQKKLAEQYLPHVADLAKLYAGQGVFLEDLIGEGNVALTVGVQMLGCLERASEVQGMLGKMIMDAMEDYISENAEAGRKNRRVEERVNRVADAARSLAQDLGRKVTPEELAQETKLQVQTIRDAMRLSGYKIEDLENADQGNGEQQE
ncbi:MAG: hypothetical protein HDR26_08360 [Lachnospiraceae bacterium]|nr:hypothetical protein [Lachnospiraceae bacterium]